MGNLIQWYNSVQNACRSHEFEVILISPFLPPEEILIKSNITFIHSYCSPTVSFMQGAALARGEFVVNFTDDCLYIEESLSNAINIFESSYEEKDILNLNYIENVLDVETLQLIKEPKPFPSYYWVAGTYPDYRKPSIKPEWQLAPHFLMKRKYFNDLGGIDCRFDYLNLNLHDLVFRAQFNGSKVYQSIKTCSLCSYLPEETGDHFAIHRAGNEKDVPLFNFLYGQSDVISSRIHLNLEDWKNCPRIWDRRFNKNNLKLSNSYEA